MKHCCLATLLGVLVFYDTLDSTIKSVPSKEELFIMKDFNARVGADFEAWPSVISHHGIGKINENCQRLLELCSPQPCGDQHLLPEQGEAQSFMVSPKNPTDGIS